MRMLVTPHPAFVSKETSADEIAKTLVANPRLKSVYVVDDNQQLIGKITLKMLIKHEFMDLLPSRFGVLDFGSLEFVGKKTAEDRYGLSYLCKGRGYVKNSVCRDV